MNITVRTHETRNNTYHLIKSAKTSYEEQQERKEERNYMIIQKSIGLFMILVSIILLVKVPDAEFKGFMLLVTLLGLALTVTKDHAITI